MKEKKMEEEKLKSQKIKEQQKMVVFFLDNKRFNFFKTCPFYIQ